MADIEGITREHFPEFRVASGPDEKGVYLLTAHLHGNGSPVESMQDADLDRDFFLYLSIRGDEDDDTLRSYAQGVADLRNEQVEARKDPNWVNPYRGRVLEGGPSLDGPWTPLWLPEEEN